MSYADFSERIILKILNHQMRRKANYHVMADHYK